MNLQLVVKISRLREIARRLSIYQNVPCNIFYLMHCQLYLSKFTVNHISSWFKWFKWQCYFTSHSQLFFESLPVHQIDFELAVPVVLLKFLDSRSFWRYPYHQLLLRAKIRSASCLATKNSLCQLLSNQIILLYPSLLRSNSTVANQSECLTIRGVGGASMIDDT